MRPCRSGIDRGQEAADAADRRPLDAAQAHRSARVGFGEIDQREAVALGHVEEARVGIVGGRFPVDRPAGVGDTSEPLIEGFLSLFRFTVPSGRKPRPQLVEVPYLVVTTCSPVTRSTV